MATASSSPTTNVPGKFTAVWVDGTGRSWHIEADAARIVLVANEDVLDLPRASWSRDIYVADHDNGYIIRIENFDHSVGFLVSEDQARALVAILGRTEAETDVLREDTPRVAEHSHEPSRTELLWPKVSPLAVWSLICAAPAFIPVLGWPPAIASVILLVLHHRRVPRSGVWRHSRALCLAATLFLVAGLLVSILGTLAGARNTNSSLSTHSGTAINFEAPPEDRSPERTARSAPAVQRASFLDEDHNWGLIIAGLVLVMLSLTVHEGAHAITAWWLGDDFAKRLGRVTINPLVHIDPLGTVILPLILFLSGMMVFGWAKPVPVRTSGLSRPRRAHILISLAGPGSNLLLAAASLLLLLGISSAVWITTPTATIENLTGLETAIETVQASGFALAPVVGPVCTLLKLSFLINTFLAFFNLIPIPPLDGSWVLEHSFPRTLGPFYARLRPYAFMLFLGLMYIGVLKWLLMPAVFALGAGFAILASCTPF